MAVTQSRTQVNDKSSGAEPMQKLNPSAVVPGQSVSEIGGPTIYDYRPHGDSAAIENEGTSQSKSIVNDKAAPAADTGGGTGGATLCQIRTNTNYLRSINTGDTTVYNDMLTQS